MSPDLPPLLRGLATAGDPFEGARQEAARGCDAGLVLHRLTGEAMEAALVLAPEVPLADAVAMLPACGVGLQNALGALAPPEVAVRLTWGGELRVNGAACGALRAAAASREAGEVPGWLVVGLAVEIGAPGEAPGERPGQTCLAEEGCGEIGAARLLESWSRHALTWIHRWDTEGPRPLHAEWSGILDPDARPRGLGRRRRALRGDRQGRRGHADRADDHAAGGAVTGPGPQGGPAAGGAHGGALNLARAIHFDESDTRVFHVPARTGEWCVAGGFEFSNWSEADLTGKARQAFANGWLGLETFGRVTFVAVTRAEGPEVAALTERLAAHFVAVYGAPSLEVARPAAAEEIAHMAALCEGLDANTLLTVARELTEGGVREAFRSIEPASAEIDAFAVHGDPGGEVGGWGGGGHGHG